MTTPAQPPTSGDQREDQAAVSGAAAGLILAGAATAILGSMAAAIAAVVAGSLSVSMAKRKIRQVIAAQLGAASARLRRVYAQAARDAAESGEAAGRPAPRAGQAHGGQGAAQQSRPAARTSRGTSGGGKKAAPVLPDAPKQVERAILNAQRDAGQAFDAAMHAALGGKGGPLPPSNPYRDAVDKAMRRLTGVGADVKDLTGAERAAQSLSRLQAAQVVMDDLAAKGLTGFTDSAGRRWSLDAYAEMATRTAASRLHLSTQLSMMAQAGNDLVIVDNPAKAAPCPKCVLPGTVVEGPAPEWRIATEYSGDVIRITTASGKDLTGTPDHAVLTPQGWRRLKELHPGDQVISNAGQEFACPAAAIDVGVVVPDDIQMPALIENAGETVAPLLLARPPRCDLDSDVSYREVKVVWPDGLLLDELDAALAEPPGNLGLVSGIRFADAGLALCDPLLALQGQRNAASSGMSVVEHGGALFGSSAVPAAAHRSGVLLAQGIRVHGLDRPPDSSPSRPGLHSGEPEVIGDTARADSERWTEFLRGLSGDVPPDQISSLRVGELARPDAVRYGSLAIVPEDGRGPRVADMEGGHELLKRLAGTVAPDEILSIDIGHYSGHVWDLQTAPSWYLTNGIVTHNCRPWEGKVLSLSGMNSGPSTITDASGVQRTQQIAGTLAEAVAAGLLHNNCRHSLIPWTDGAGAVATAGGQERGYVEQGQPTSYPLPIGTPQQYKDEQKLRAHEQNVRAASMRVAASVTPQARAKARAHLAHARAGLEAHVRATGATRLPGREKAGKAR